MSKPVAPPAPRSTAHGTASTRKTNAGRKAPHPALRSINHSSSRSEKNSPPKRQERQAPHPREFAAKRTIRSVHSTNSDSVPSANHSAYASNVPNQVLKARPAVMTASLNTGSMNCVAELGPKSLLNNRAGKKMPQPDDYDTSSISHTLDSSTPDVEP